MMRARWRKKLLTAGLVALAGLGGCKQQVFLDKADFDTALYRGFPTHLETQPYAAVGPITPLDKNDTLPTVLDPTRPPEYVSLQRCIAIGLEQGNTGLIDGTGNNIEAAFSVNFRGGPST